MAKAVRTKEDSQEKGSKLTQKLQELEKKFGAGVVISGKDIEADLEIVTTGSIGLDVATNLWGLPVGKLVEYMGMESSGKSTATLHNIANYQKIGKVVLCDFEQSFDKNYAAALGISVDDLIILQPDCLEDGYNLIQGLIETGEIRLVVIDSHTAGMPKKVVDGEVGDASVGLQARINSQALGKIKPLLKANRCTMIGISQIRQDIGSMGEVNKATGGLAWKFYSDMRMKFAKVQTDKEKESNKTEINVIKNKCASPWGKAIVQINWGKGYDRDKEIIDAAVEYKLIDKGGSWYTVKNLDTGEQIHKCQGEVELRKFLEDNGDYMTEMESRVIQLLKGEE